MSENTTTKPAFQLFGLQGRLLTLAIIPVLLTGAALFYSVNTNVSYLINDLYEQRTNQTMRVLMGNIDFSQPKEIEREFKQAMKSSEIIAMYFIQKDQNGQQNAQMVYRDDNSKTIFETLEPKFLEVSSQNQTTQIEYFLSYNFYDAGKNLYTTRGSGIGGRNGATQTNMLRFTDRSKLEIPTATNTENGFGVVVIEDGRNLETNIWNIAWNMIWFLIGTIIVAIILAIVVSQTVIRPVRHLTKLANAMSTGDLETPITIKSRDEIGTLGQALERTRLSLKIALERTQRKRADQNTES
jgi:HAMP domain-containing protein